KRYRKKKWDLDHKTLPEAKKPPEPEALPEPRRRVPRPTDAQTPGLCYDWYLQEFEERLETKDD
ncbi:MAG: hypothetical protein KDK78_12345, partial [Chlamydiia bacterium]|nr:hypothetical protein [Chlamydiia bacterium]